MNNRLSGELIRLGLLGIAVVVEGVLVVSILARSEFFPLGVFYPNIISLAFFIMPSVVGGLSRRLPVAILLSMLPFWMTTAVYLAIFAPVWTVDLFLGAGLAERVAGFLALLALLGLFGWLIRYILLDRKNTSADSVVGDTYSLERSASSRTAYGE